MIPQHELDKYIEILKSVDWYYSHANGNAYYEGQRKYYAARHATKNMIEKYPDDAEQINKLWENHGHAED